MSEKSATGTMRKPWVKVSRTSRRFHLSHVSCRVFSDPACALLPNQSLCKDTFGSSTHFGDDPTRKEQNHAAKD